MGRLAIHYLSHGYPTGYGVAGWRLALALIDAGVSLRWTPIDFHHLAPAFPPGRPSHPVLDAHRDVGGRPDVIVLHAVAELIPALDAARGDIPLVCHTVWENDHIQEHWPALLNRCAGVIVPTDWNAEVFRRGGVTVPIEVVPHVRAPLDTPADDTWLGDVAGRFVVYSIAAWEPRKAPWRTIEAYAKAFAPDDDGVMLVLKSGRFHESPDPRFQGPPGRERMTWWALAMLLRELGPVPPLVLSDAVLTDAEINGLHHRGDCWLSLPHAEGWDLGAFDAATAGTPVITTDWAAPPTYLDRTAAHLVPARLVPKHIVPDPPHPTMRWAEPDLDDAVDALRWVRDHPEEARRRAAGQAEALRARFAPPVVAAEALAALERILAHAP